MVSPNDGWTFARYSTAACSQPAQFDPKTGQIISPFQNPACKTTNHMLHYDGHTWADEGVVNFTLLGRLVMVSPSEGWALGLDVARSRLAVVRYSGSYWFVDHAYDFPIPTPGEGLGLESLAMLNANEGWAVGTHTDNASLALLMHYTQGKWVRQPLPGDLATATADLHSISMLSADEGWAVGTDSPTYGPVLILRYHNGEWTRVDVPFPGSLNSVYTVSPHEAWAVGEENPSFGPGLILHYKAGTWTKVTGLQLNILHAVTMGSPTEGWVVGDGAMFLHYDNGIWSKVGQPIYGFMLTGVSMASATEGWAVGYYLSNPAPDGKNLFHYTGGQWTPYSLAVLMRQLGQG